MEAGTLGSRCSRIAATNSSTSRWKWRSSLACTVAERVSEVSSHHSPVRTDQALDELTHLAADAAVPVTFAYEGLRVET